MHIIVTLEATPSKVWIEGRGLAWPLHLESFPTPMSHLITPRYQPWSFLTFLAKRIMTSFKIDTCGNISIGKYYLDGKALHTVEQYAEYIHM